MISPSREEFQKLAQTHSVIPITRELLADLITPVAMYLRLVGDGQGFLLESVEHGQRWGRWSFVGRNPLATITCRGMDVVVDPPLSVEVPVNQGVLCALDAVMAAFSSPELDDLPPFHSGVIGYLGYDVVREVEHLPNVPADDRGFPDAVMSVVGELAAFDHWRQRVTLIANVLVDSSATSQELNLAYDDALSRLENMAADGAKPLDEPMIEPPRGDDEPPVVTPTMSAERFQLAVEAAREYVFSGDTFQTVLSTRFDFDLDAHPYDFYRALRQINPSPYMYYLRLEGMTIAGSSPEPMVQLIDGRVISRPIAGTRKRGRNETHDRRLAAELMEHPKEVAEHVMLVDLGRNDVGRVVKFGTCQVTELMTLERYSHVMHLTSQVEGDLADGKSPVDVIRATMPAGTVSGSPKVRSMEIIDELEATKRGPYAGLIGYLDFSGNIDAAITIRTLVVDDQGRASVQAGAGVVADSVAADEELETRNKARALLCAVPAARRMSAARRANSQSI